MKQGLIIINLGTPEESTTRAVRRYLFEFLSDPRVIDLPPLIRYLIIFATILPTRPRQSAKAYQAIWTRDGSPLLVHSQNLKNKLQKELSETVQVELAMRYGKPSISEALARLKGCSRLTILPLYPQYASATTGSTLEKIFEVLGQQTVIPEIKIINQFYDHPAFIQSQARMIAPYLKDHDHLLMSYHGLPTRQLLKAGCRKACSQACPAISQTNANCYRAQCYASSEALAIELQLQSDQYSVSFQSRLGRTPWIQPYTDEILKQLRLKGIKRLAVTCPSFVADCLETLEEINIRGKEQWQALGGENLTLIPALNAEDHWVSNLIKIISFQ